jgi:outer membrane lipoprotein SlyB
VRRRAALALAAFALACASPRPVLYPNATYERVGKETADADVNTCVANAKENVKSRDAQEIATDTAGNAAAGGAAGAVGGAISGGGAGIGAAIGAATAATWGFVKGLFRLGTRGPDDVQRRYAERCLADRGYDVIGWR